MGFYPVEDAEHPKQKTTRYAGGSERLYHGEYRHAIMRLFKPKKRKEGKNNGKPNTQSVTHKMDV